MNKELYISAVNEIQVDSGLLFQTAQKMKQQQAQARRYYPRVALAACIAIFLLATLTIKNIYNTNKIGNLAKLTAGKSITLADRHGMLYINKLEGIRAGRLLVPEGAYYKEVTLKELTEYFGRDPLPAPPKQFKPENNTASITFKPDGTIFFMTPFRYYSGANTPEAPSITIQLNKGALPPRDCFYGPVAPKLSTIETTSVTIGSEEVSSLSPEQTSPSEPYYIYSAQFIYKDIGYNITAKKIDGQDFIKLLQAIIK